MESNLESSWDVFKWISDHAIDLGRERRDNRFAQLGTGLFLLYGTPPRLPGQAAIDSKLLEIANIVNEACGVSWYPCHLNDL